MLAKDMEVDMLVDKIRRAPAKVLTEEQRESYWEKGYLLLERLIPEEWLERLRAATDEMVERSRAVTDSDRVFDLEPDHTADAPRLRRVTSPVDQHPDYWAYARDSLLADIAADLVGPDVAFHHSKLNFKWARGGAEVKWHQDIQYWPHTNYTPLTFGTYLYDCGVEQGPLGVLPGSHEGLLYDLYADDGSWAGALSDGDAAGLDTESTVYLPGPAGSVTIHNCRTVHHSAANDSPIGRPLLLNVYKAADAMPYTANPLPSSHAEEVVRGERARWTHHDPRPCLVPPDWSGGYTSLFALQQKESAPGSM
jgi:ectoine hydroxylase-related dioxygenase (phytanoyl-CoA dioxygenase family)